MIELLSNRGFIKLNKTLIKKIGISESVILCELIGEYLYWKEKCKLEDGYFYSTRSNIEKNTGLTSRQQRSAIEKLVDLNLIKVKIKNMPRLNYYRILENNIKRLLSS